ncbi:MAG: hypothetical protein RQ745_14160, partial [Longimicrobiales bacterium]|nr:hypothetical protein [Longimicrobiales bacterium]
MRRTRPLRSTAALLLVLSGALSTGLPSHHHEGAEPAEDEVRVVSTDHHSHGTELVEQDKRTPAGAPQIAVTALSE